MKQKLTALLTKWFYTTKTDGKGKTTVVLKWWADRLLMLLAYTLLCYWSASSLSTGLGIHISTWTLFNLLLGVKLAQVAFNALSK